MTDICPYPWQQDQWQSILQQKNNDQLPHAYMLVGQRGTGKWHFARTLAHYLLCHTPKSDLPCGECKSCLMLNSGNHPDLMQVEPETRHKGIKIDQVRELSRFLSKTAQQQGYKVAMIGPVEQLNLNAGNALLKSLEEPAGKSVLILTSNVTDSVMATIKSRCQLLPMPGPSRQGAIEWFAQLNVKQDGEALLDISALSPLQAADLLEEERYQQLQGFLDGLLALHSQGDFFDPSLVKPWLDLELVDLLDWWIQLVNLVLHRSGHSSGHSLQQSAASANYRYNQDEGAISAAMDQLLSSTEKYDTRQVFSFLDKLVTLKRQQINGANPNKQLLLEDLTIVWRRLNYKAGFSPDSTMSIANL